MKNLSDIDALFTLPLAEFTTARNALAARLKKEKRADEAQTVKSLTKPSATAWAVNQLYWQHRREFDRLLEINERVRQAQITAAANLRSLLDERRSMISALSEVAASLLSDAGHAATVEAMRRVTITLESLTARDRHSVEQLAGRLTADLEPLGFDMLSALLAATPIPSAKVVDFGKAAKEKQRAKEEQERVEEERKARLRAEAIERAEAALVRAREEAFRAETQARDAAAQRARLDEERRRLEERLATAADAERRAAEEVQKTARGVAEAQLALARVRSET